MPETIELHFTEAGSGPPLVLLHGLFGNGRNLAALAKGLSEHYRVLSPDLRNHGRSPHSDIMDYPTLAADIIALMDRQDIESAIIAGYSMGGKVAMMTALEYPERVEKLVVLDISPVKYRRGTNSLIQRVFDLPIADIANRAEADALLATDVPDDRVRGFMLQNLKPTDSGLQWRINLTALRENRTELADFPEMHTTYAGPALFLYGKTSGYIWPEHHNPILRLFPSAAIQPIADAGHWLHIEQPDAVLAAIVDFLTDDTSGTNRRKCR